MLGLVLPQLVAKTAWEMALRWPRLGFSSHFLQPIYLSIYLSLQKTSASPLSLSIYLSKYRAPLKFQLYLRKKNAIQGERRAFIAFPGSSPGASPSDSGVSSASRLPGGKEYPPPAPCRLSGKKGPPVG